MKPSAAQAGHGAIYGIQVIKDEGPYLQRQVEKLYSSWYRRLKSTAENQFCLWKYTCYGVNSNFCVEHDRDERPDCSAKGLLKVSANCHRQ